MNSLAQIEFYFPNIHRKSSVGFVNNILRDMRERGSISRAGYADEKSLRNGLLRYIGSGSTHGYRTISDTEKKNIGKIILRTIEKCNKTLKIPVKNFIFVYPYFPSREDNIFEGVMAVAAYSCVFHVFIDFHSYTLRSLENTIAHELNHTIYYYHHYDNFNNYALLEEIIIEGLAENFREQLFDHRPTPWAVALSRQKAIDILANSEDILDSHDPATIKNFLLGGKKYKKWTGYSIGYWITKTFIEDSRLSWNKIMKIPPEIFLEFFRQKRKEGK
jgi:uncharacterized protein YjaZ